MTAHLESGHYFNPHAQRIIEGKMAGAKLAVIDPRLSNTASAANYWLLPWPGTEAALLLAMASVILHEDTFDREFVRRWVNWEEFMRERAAATAAVPLKPSSTRSKNFIPNTRPNMRRPNAASTLT